MDATVVSKISRIRGWLLIILGNRSDISIHFCETRERVRSGCRGRFALRACPLAVARSLSKTWTLGVGYHSEADIFNCICGG
jgi:hypothetical protein